MKRFIIGLLVLLSVTGCETNMDNTPTKKVEAFLNKYQMLDDDIMDDLNTSINGLENLNEQQRNDYVDIMKSGYQKMTYTIKDEAIDGNEATVIAQIKVVNYAKVLDETDSYLEENEDQFMTDGEYDESLFMDYKISQLKDNTEMIEYTVDFTLTKEDDEWVLDDITDEIRDKINGRY